MMNTLNNHSAGVVVKNDIKAAPIEKAPESASDLFAVSAPRQPMTTTTTTVVSNTNSITQPPSSASELFGLSSRSLNPGKYNDVPMVSSVTNLTAPPIIQEYTQNNINAAVASTTDSNASTTEDSFLPPPPILSDITHNAVTNNDGVVGVPTDAGLGNVDLPPPPMMDVSF